MKTKSFKKLVLNKKTIANLNENAMNHVKGGVVWTGCLSDCTAGGCPQKTTATFKPY